MEQCARTVLMVRPRKFGYNPETAIDNAFQSDSLPSAQTVAELAKIEFDDMVSLLKQAGIRVLVLDEDDGLDPSPDEVFPNNWVVTGHDGWAVAFPVAIESRKREVRIDALKSLFEREEMELTGFLDMRENLPGALEGTGSMVIDHQNCRIYAAHSKRCNAMALEAFASHFNDYDVFLFDTVEIDGSPVYHTNVILSIGEHTAVVCEDAIVPGPVKDAVLASLRESHKVIPISIEQVKSFCGNILQLKNIEGKPYYVMSQSAFQGFHQEQLEVLRAHGDLIVPSVGVIERGGGGSVRCMMAEVFLQPKSQVLSSVM